MSKRIGARRRKLLCVSFSAFTASEVEALAKARHIAKSRLIREALATHARNLEPPNITRRNELAVSNWRLFGIRIGPVMADTIRAQSRALNASASAIVEACCLTYVSRSFLR